MKLSTAYTAAAMFIAAGLASCSDPDDTEWDPGWVVYESSVYDEWLGLSRAWDRRCVLMSARAEGLSYEDWSARYWPQEAAARFGDLAAIDCQLEATRQDWENLEPTGDADLDQSFFIYSLIARYRALYVADLRGRDTRAEWEALCSLFQDDILAGSQEDSATLGLANAAAFGVLSQQDLALARQRDAVRSPCSERNRAGQSDAYPAD